MSETAHIELRQALRQRLIGLSGLPPEAQRAWEGRSFTPTKNTPWLRERLMPLDSRVVAPGHGGYEEHTVTYQISLFHPPGTDTQALELLAGRVRKHFQPGTPIFHGWIKAWSQQATRSAVLAEPDWLQVAVSVRVMAHTPILLS